MQDIEKLAADSSAPGTPYAVQTARRMQRLLHAWLRYSVFCRISRHRRVGSAIAPDSHGS